MQNIYPVVNTESEQNIKTESQNDSSEIDADSKNISKTAPFKKKKNPDNESPVNRNNLTTEIKDNREEFRLTGFEKEGYRRNCSLNSEIFNRALEGASYAYDEYNTKPSVQV